MTYSDFEEGFCRLMGVVIGLALGGLAFWLMFWVLFPIASAP